jgi:hypothetical protein
MSTFFDAFKELFSVWKEMLSAFWAVLPKVISVCLWVLTAILILPCVFIANNIYPSWVKWGEDF